MTITIIDYNHQDREHAEQLVWNGYSAAFGATLHDFPKIMVASYNNAGRMEAACGVRLSEDEFFAQQYMDEPLAKIASRSFNRGIYLSDILEFTTLSSRRPGASLRLISKIVNLGIQWGLHVAVFTATRPLRNLLQRAGVPLIAVCPASAARIPMASSWGRYYDTDPWVCMVDDGRSTPHQIHSPVFATVSPVASTIPTAVSHIIEASHA